MGNGTSGNRTCERCGYLLSPFDSDCPRCARLAEASPAASGPAADRPDVYPPDSRSRRGLDARGIAQVVAAAISFFVGTRLVADQVSVGHVRDESFWYCLIGGLLGCILLGYALGTPHAWKGAWQRTRRPMWQDNMVFQTLEFAHIGCAVMVGAGALLLLTLTDDPSYEVVELILVAGPFYVLASALLSRLLYTWLRRKS